MIVRFKTLTHLYNENLKHHQIMTSNLYNNIGTKFTITNKEDSLKLLLSSITDGLYFCIDEPTYSSVLTSALCTQIDDI